MLELLVLSICVSSRSASCATSVGDYVIQSTTVLLGRVSSLLQRCSLGTLRFSIKERQRRQELLCLRFDPVMAKVESTPALSKVRKAFLLQLWCRLVLVVSVASQNSDDNNILRFFLDCFVEEESTAALSKVRLLLFCSAAPLVLFMSAINPRQMELFVSWLGLLGDGRKSTAARVSLLQPVALELLELLQPCRELSAQAFHVILCHPQYTFDSRRRLP